MKNYDTKNKKNLIAHKAHVIRLSLNKEYVNF